MIFYGTKKIGRLNGSKHGIITAKVKGWGFGNKTVAECPHEYGYGGENGLQ